MTAVLKPLSPDMGEDVYRMLQEIADGENGFSNPAYGLDWAAFQAWLRQEADYAQGRGLP